MTDEITSTTRQDLSGKSVYVVGLTRGNDHLITDNIERDGEVRQKYIDVFKFLKAYNLSILNESANYTSPTKRSVISVLRKADYVVILPDWVNDPHSQLIVFNALVFGIGVYEVEPDAELPIRAANITFSIDIRHNVDNVESNVLSDVLKEIKG